MLLYLKGFVIGLGKIIPGVSGSLLAIRLNLYEDIICSINNFFSLSGEIVITPINNFFSNIKSNLIFLGKLGLGLVTAIIIGSHMIIYLLDRFYLPTMIIFILLILSGIPSVLKETKNYLVAFISFLLYILILYIPNLNIMNTNYFMMGFLEAFTTIIPGISGTALFISIGMYDELLDMFSNILSFEVEKLVPFSFGIIIGTLIIVRFIDYCFKKYRDKTYGVILGLLIGSIFSMIIKR